MLLAILLLCNHYAKQLYTGLSTSTRVQEGTFILESYSSIVDAWSPAHSTFWGLPESLRGCAG